MKKKLLVLLFSLAALALVACGGGNDVASSGASAVSAAVAPTPDANTAATPRTTPESTPIAKPKINGQIDERTGVAPMVAIDAEIPIPGSKEGLGLQTDEYTGKLKIGSLTIGWGDPICKIKDQIGSKKEGDTCVASCQCTTKDCGGLNGAYYGKCAPEKYPDGADCRTNKDCASDYCQGNTGGIPYKVLYPLVDKEYGPSGIGKCIPYKAANGEGCYINDHCKSDYCLANTSGLRYGQCGDRYNNPKGYQCTLGSQCASGTCKGNGIVGGLPGICG